MTKPTARIIAAVVAIGVVCCSAAVIVAVHSPEEAKNATPEQVPEEVQGGENMTSEEIWERAQEIYESLHRSGIVERALEEANMTQDELPDDVTEELKNTVQFEDIIRTWELDPQNKQVVIYASLALNEEHEMELSAVQGRQVGGWTFNVVWESYVPSFVRRALKEANMTLEELPDEVKEEMKNTEIGGMRKWELDPQNNRVIVYTYIIRSEKYETEVKAVQGRQVGGWTFNVVQEHHVPVGVRRALSEANMTAEGLPDEVKEEMENIVQFVDIGSVRTWELDPQNKQATIYVYSIPDENDVDAIQGRQVGGWTFKVVHDADYEKEYEKELEQLGAELVQLQEDHPELQISGFMTSPTEIGVWVRNLTPENEALNDTVIHNRTVRIYWSPIDYALRIAREEAGW
ncbi:MULTISPECIES: hypothetical protein [unclassified Methanoculleus]|uniref:hypothetical protein n=1 Tax=unclassified Methanoculleus TaxID=2619537 RepID=UPI0025DAA28B|nr:MULTISPECIES: hypothetical protein [unclassified Methanoculleus]